jgi:glyoxylate/hydroxypyruvate reductase A
MGLGQLGARTADCLVQTGFRVVGWRRTPREMSGIYTYAGRDQLDAFLREVSILVCMLPLTSQTRGILNRKTFSKLKPGAFVINVARGEHLIEDDLLDALETGRLSGACLDVFQTEPLPKEHPFWQRPEIIVTPHISSLTNPADVVPQIVDNYRRLFSGQPLLNAVDVHRGY